MYFQPLREETGFKPVELIKKKEGNDEDGMQFSQITVMDGNSKGKGGKRNRKGGKKQGQVISDINF